MKNITFSKEYYLIFNEVEYYLIFNRKNTLFSAFIIKQTVKFIQKRQLCFA